MVSKFYKNALGIKIKPISLIKQVDFYTRQKVKSELCAYFKIIKSTISLKFSKTHTKHTLKNTPDLK